MRQDNSVHVMKTRTFTRARDKRSDEHGWDTEDEVRIVVVQPRADSFRSLQKSIHQAIETLVRSFFRGRQ